METIVQELVPKEELKKFEKVYQEQLQRGEPSVKAQFDYSWCLVRSPYKRDLHQGIALLEDLYHKTTDDNLKRDYLFYLSVGNTRIKDYNKALKYVKALLTIEPGNHQAQELKEYIDQKMKKEGLVGMAIVGGAAALAIGGIVSLGVALARK
ncbi:Mitochondrial fission 1 protein [Lamellibrachia satsuma]|nr:Mitochondrial fission 1 protein [Lamellibrachia satsuma]